jgi:hypothetical protein
MDDVPPAVASLAVVSDVVLGVFALQQEEAEYFELVVRQFLERQGVPPLTPVGFLPSGVDLGPCLRFRGDYGS